MSSMSWPPPGTTGRHPLVHRSPRSRPVSRPAAAEVETPPCGEGVHGQRIFDGARVGVRPWHCEVRRHCVLARRSVSRPEEVSYYIAYCPADTTLDGLIRIAGSRWAVAECFQAAKLRQRRRGKL